MNSNNKKTKKNKKQSRATVTSVPTLGGFSDRSRVRLRYVSEFSLTSATVACVDQVFAGNDVYDPDVTGVGGQPANFDDFSAVYLRYRVWGSTITVYPAVEVDATDDGIRLVIGPRHTSTALVTHSTQNDFIAQPYSRFEVLTYYNTKVREGKIKLPYMSTQKFMGLTDTEFEGQDDLSALVTASPAHRFFWHVTQSNCNSANTNVAFYTAVIDYDVEFWDRVDTTLDLDGQIDRLVKLKEAKEGFVSVPESKGNRRGERKEKIL